MKILKITISILSITGIFALYSKGQSNIKDFNIDGLMVRIAEIEIKPNSLDEYTRILQEEAEASIRLEAGVICIFPMFQKGSPTEIRILEIYANKEAYESHLLTPHFKHYKTTTSDMVLSLKLVDMEAIDKETMSMIFKKLSR